MGAALQHQHIEHSLYRVRGFHHLFDVFPDGLPPAGKPIGSQNPQAAAAFHETLLFIAKHIGAEVLEDKLARIRSQQAGAGSSQ
jgi:hypothetical protein